jgi:hypothetical protein
MDKLCGGLEQSTTHFVGKGEAALPASEQLIETMELGSFVDQATHHSLQRLHSLLAEGEIQ